MLLVSCCRVPLFARVELGQVPHAFHEHVCRRDELFAVLCQSSVLTLHQFGNSQEDFGCLAENHLLVALHLRLRLLQQLITVGLSFRQLSLDFA